ncbi:hypothetical protein HH212_25895 [Massilia forsythiae]|uniref:Glycine zipper domain-containing protein n=1 Tax=Massilia forsythiae TaxID=2728020 RepID=A0A7Z2W0Q1_9BURK|nr:glycine zipper domain-containing protein [Massilia forsythiae]QJE02993.1 hypothetical protein HH212_25895 [Massilia forsythiae]
MSIIIAGHFQLQDEVDRARRELVAAGFPNERISAFYLSQPGQHDMTPIGGDHLHSPGAKESPEGVVQGASAGAAVGAVAGAATAPLTGPIGAVVGGLVGAHVGSLFSFSKMKDPGEKEEGGRAPVENRPAGMLIAVAFDDQAIQQQAVDLLRRLGAHHIERAQGNIVDGDWADFDPSTVPDIIH